MELILYTGPNCALCEKAKQVIYPVIARAEYKLVERNITDNVEWLRKYRLTIPVVEVSGRQLGWPFDEAALAKWMAQG